MRFCKCDQIQHQRLHVLEDLTGKLLVVKFRSYDRKF